MNTIEVLTLLLVIFAALSYIDNHNNKKEIAPHCPRFGAISYNIILRANRSHIRLPLSRLYSRVAEKSTTLLT